MSEQFRLTDLLEGILVESQCKRFPSDDRFLQNFFYSQWDSGRYAFLRCLAFNVSGEYPQMGGIDHSLGELEQIRLIVPTSNTEFFDVSSKIKGHYRRHVKKNLLPEQYDGIKSLASDFSKHLEGWAKSPAPQANF